MPKVKSKNRRLLKCKVSNGMFTNEVFIVIELPSGTNHTAVVDKSLVSFTEGDVSDLSIPTAAGIWVDVAKEEPDSLLVDLPRETFSGGTRLIVPKTLLLAT